MELSLLQAQPPSLLSSSSVLAPSPLSLCSWVGWQWLSCVSGSVSLSWCTRHWDKGGRQRGQSRRGSATASVGTLAALSVRVLPGGVR